MKVLAAMSGGVDSSVVAALLVEQGHDVTGVHLKLSDAQPAAEDGRVHGCCGLTDADDARRVAQVLDIPFYVWNLRDEFAEGIVEDFVSEYARGRTPNPCVRCNERVKFGTLLDRAEALGFDAVATGHYARLREENGVWRLSRARDAAKDQSYVLARTPQERLGRCSFPLGDMTKPEVRAEAARFGLRTASKPESYDICFVPDGDAGAFVGERLDPVPGPLVDPNGEPVGEHRGVHAFTIGQRRGLGVGSHRRLHVLEIRPETATVVVGPRELLARRVIEAEDAVWTLGSPARFDHIQIRAHGAPIPARASLVDGGRLTIELEEPAEGVAPGQLVACYDGDDVVAGATIAAAR